MDLHSNKALATMLAGAAAVAAVVQVVRHVRPRRRRPVVVATWKFGKKACEEAGLVLTNDYSAVDAVESGIHAIELDDTLRSCVGFGGLPNEAGVMEHDAAIMDGRTLNMGVVMALQSIACPIRVARRLLDQPHLNCLVGQGALKFAQNEGFRREMTQTAWAAKEFDTWRQTHGNQDDQLNLLAFVLGAQNHPWDHDTVGVIALDKNGDICVGVSTSGKAFKHEGRVGDAPLVGSGFYADNTVGAATATGDGEEIMKTCLSFLVVEGMRAGASPMQACQRAIDRVVSLCNKQPLPHVSVVALDMYGTVGAASTIGPSSKMPDQPDATSNPAAFEYAVWVDGKTEVHSVCHRT